MRPLLYLKDVVTLAFDVERCTGCGMCLAVCPREVFQASDGKVEVACVMRASSAAPADATAPAVPCV